MKNVFKLSLLGLAFMSFFVSCEKSEPVVVEEEGLKSPTGDQQLTIEADPQAAETEVLFHKHYSSTLSAEEAETKWNNDVKEFDFPPSLKGSSTEWFYNVSTRTGTQSNNGTDGRVECTIRYRTDIGYYTKSRANLNNAGDDREGGWDYYLVRSFISGKAIKWIELRNATIYLKGKDGWFVTNFKVCLRPNSQNIPATNFSHIHSEPNVWLDNSSSSGWDSYYTGNIGYGRMTF